MSQLQQPKTDLVPLSQPLGSGTAGQAAESGTKGGTRSLKALANRVLERDSSRDKHRDSLSHEAGQEQGGVGQAQATEAQRYMDMFEERAGFLEHDNGVPREVAERRALEECADEYLSTMSGEHANPARCLHCNGFRRGRTIPFIGENLSGLWVHEACAAQWKQERYAYAVKQLKDMGVGS